MPDQQSCRSSLSPSTPSPAHRGKGTSRQLLLTGALTFAVILLVTAAGDVLAGRSPAKVALEDFTIAMTEPVDAGSLHPGQSFTLQVRVTANAAGVEPPDLVAVISCPQLPTRMIPLEVIPEQTGSSDARRLAGEVLLDAPYFDELKRDRHRLPVTFRIAARSALRLHTLATKTFHVTVTKREGAGRALADEPSLPTLPLALTDAPLAEPVGIVDPPAESMALAPARIQEESLVPAAASKPDPAYWHLVTSRIAQQLQGVSAEAAPHDGQAVPTVHFRLYANGQAQSIRLEPGTGDSALDHALVQSIVDAQPFPPFPRDVTEAHLDVHLAMPMFSLSTAQK